MEIRHVGSTKYPLGRRTRPGKEQISHLDGLFKQEAVRKQTEGRGQAQKQIDSFFQTKEKGRGHSQPDLNIHREPVLKNNTSKDMGRVNWAER